MARNIIVISSARAVLIVSRHSASELLSIEIHIFLQKINSIRGTLKNINFNCLHFYSIQFTNATHLSGNESFCAFEFPAASC